MELLVRAKIKYKITVPGHTSMDEIKASVKKHIKNGTYLIESCKVNILEDN